MSKNKKDISQDISPDRGPFAFHAWLELPFLFPMTVKQTLPVIYRGSMKVELDLEIYSPSYKVVTGNEWMHGRDFRKWLEAFRAGEEKSNPPIPTWEQEYTTENEIDIVIESKVTPIVKTTERQK